ncbi:MAG: J domain-containing protein [Acidimicrobiia bacterium]|nr:J domain-containing protein [Acidimicrobiia bacterium]
MARRRNPDDASEGAADLGAPEHLWWTSTPIDPFRRDEPRADAAPDDEATPPTPPPEHDVGVETKGEVVPDDPYEVLRLPTSATWEEIVASYRKLARWYHPDGLVDPGPDDLASCEAMIRRLNAAYAELRVRRGR